MNKKLLLCLATILVLLSACQRQVSKCQQPTVFPKYITNIPLEKLAQTTPEPDPTAQMIEIGGQMVSVDKVIEGPLCNDAWKGTVYVSCNVQVYAWEEQPDFLINCDLKIDPNTVVYVAHHNDTAYYKGCSCHSGEIAEP